MFRSQTFIIVFVLLRCYCLIASRKQNMTQVWTDILTSWEDYSQKGHLYVPDIFILGTSRAGVRSFYELLIQHSQICRTHQPAIHYFDNDDNWRKGKKWYEKQFEGAFGCISGTTLVDATSSYISSIDAPQRLQSSYNENDLRRKKFIVLLRNPIDREISIYKEQLFNCMQRIELSIWESYGADANTIDFPVNKSSYPGRKNDNRYM